jgi:LysM repeat protein
LILELRIGGSYRRRMKWIVLFLAATAVSVTPPLRAQDAATEERLNKLAGQIDDIRAAQDVFGKRLEALSKDIENLRSALDKPSGNYAAQEDLKRVFEAVKEVDHKRLEDYDKIRAELLKLGKTLAAPLPATKKPAVTTGGDAPPEKPTTPDKGFEYVVQKGDTLSLIVKAYRDKNITVSMDQILKANPGLKPEKLRPGQKIFIPAPPS